MCDEFEYSLGIMFLNDVLTCNMTQSYSSGGKYFFLTALNYCEDFSLNKFVVSSKVPKRIMGHVFKTANIKVET